jgi:anti-sigma regulatory factor (Ser/Thr protein kinase)
METVLTLVLPAELQQLPVFIGAVTEAAEASGVAQKTLFEIELALEEALVNIMNHAYEGTKGDIRVVCMAESGRAFVVEITDSGKDFDMTSLPAPDVTAGIDERTIGGLGIYFIKKLADRVSYRREDGKNILAITFV